MKKTILVGLMAAMMLFAFTACEGGSASTGFVTMVEASTSVEYVYGVDTPSASDFTFTGYTTTGSAVTIPSNQFTVADSEFDADAEEYNVTFNWASTEMTATGTAVAYMPEDAEVAAGTAQVQYYTVAEGTNAIENDTTDYAAVNANGATVTVTYDGTKTKTVTISDSTKIAGKALNFKFGTVDAAGDFTVAGDGKVPANAGAYAIGIFVGDEADQPIGTYDVVVNANRVKSTSLFVDPEYNLYTDGVKSITLDSSKIYVTKTMSNGQVLKAGANEVAWNEVRAALDDTMTSNSLTTAITIDVNKGATTNVFAKFVGGNVETAYTRNIMETSFTPISEEVTGVEISAYDVTLKFKAYSDEAPVVENDITGIDVSTKYNNPAKEDGDVGFASTQTANSGYTWNIGIPSIGTKVKGDSITVTVTVYNGTTVVDSKNVTAELV